MSDNNTIPKPIFTSHDTNTTWDRQPTDSEIHSACMSYRHDYGIMEPTEQKTLFQEAKLWYEAWRKEIAERK